MIVKLSNFLVLFLILQTPASTNEQELFLVVDGKTSTFISLDDGASISARESGHVIHLKLSDLSPKDLKAVMDRTGWGRVWEDDSGKFRVIADLLEVQTSSVRLQRTDGTEISVPIKRLSSTDKQYVEARRSSNLLPKRFYGKVVGVTDGDTLNVLLNKRTYKIRISGIDSPELGQDFGRKAKTALSELVFGKYVSGETEETDKYGRNICTLHIGSDRVDIFMLKAGLAWHYQKYSDDLQRTQVERLAKNSKVGIWSENNPVAPWDWRRWGVAKRKAWAAEKAGFSMPRGPPPTSLTSPTKKRSPAIGNYWLNTSSNIRHNSSCRWFRNTKSGRLCGSSDGRGCKKCGG